MSLVQRIDPRWTAQHRRSRRRAERAAATGLDPGESVVAHVYVQLKSRVDLILNRPHGAYLVLTDRRVLFFGISPIRKRTTLLAEALLSDVSFAEVKPGRVWDTVAFRWKGSTGAMSVHRLFREDLATMLFQLAPS